MRQENLSAIDLSLLVARDELPYTIEALLARRGLARHVAARVSSLAIAPLLLSRTDLICTAVERMIAPYTRGLGLRVLIPPMEFGDVQLQLIWHRRVQEDPAHRWMRELIAECFGAE